MKFDNSSKTTKLKKVSFSLTIFWPVCEWSQNSSEVPPSASNWNSLWPVAPAAWLGLWYTWQPSALSYNWHTGHRLYRLPFIEKVLIQSGLKNHEHLHSEDGWEPTDNQTCPSFLCRTFNTCESNKIKQKCTIFLKNNFFLLFLQ